MDIQHVFVHITEVFDASQRLVKCLVIGFTSQVTWTAALVVA